MNIEPRVYCAAQVNDKQEGTRSWVAMPSQAAFAANS